MVNVSTRSLQVTVFSLPLPVAQQQPSIQEEEAVVLPAPAPQERQVWWLWRLLLPQGQAQHQAQEASPVPQLVPVPSTLLFQSQQEVPQREAALPLTSGEVSPIPQAPQRPPWRQPPWTLWQVREVSTMMSSFGSVCVWNTVMGIVQLGLKNNKKNGGESTIWLNVLTRVCTSLRRGAFQNGRNRQVLDS